MEFDEATQWVQKYSETTAQKIVDMTRYLAVQIDEKTRTPNLGNNVMLNALAYSLETTLADFAARAGKDREKTFAEFHEVFHAFLNEWIAKYSRSGVSIMVDTSGMKKKEEGGE